MNELQRKSTVCENTLAMVPSDKINRLPHINQLVKDVIMTNLSLVRLIIVITNSIVKML